MVQQSLKNRIISYPTGKEEKKLEIDLEPQNNVWNSSNEINIEMFSIVGLRKVGQNWVQGRAGMESMKQQKGK